MESAERARLSLEGLALGDAFGEQFFGPPEAVLPRIAERREPAGIWRYTDDTEMALSIVEVLEDLERIDPDLLAHRFAARLQEKRGYGSGTLEILRGIRRGQDWRVLAPAVAGGRGSHGNGAAMRVAPLGAFFADANLETVEEQARRSAEVTHAHPEGIAGAVAVATGAALAWRRRGEAGPLGADWMEEIRARVPAGETRDALGRAIVLPGGLSPPEAAAVLGNGSRGSAPDTVPFCLWIAAHFSHSLEEALWQTVSALGDRDTTCAIVGGIVTLKTGIHGLPPAWLERRENLPIALGKKS